MQCVNWIIGTIFFYFGFSLILDVICKTFYSNRKIDISSPSRKSKKAWIKQHALTAVNAGLLGVGFSYIQSSYLSGQTHLVNDSVTAIGALFDMIWIYLCLDIGFYAAHKLLHTNLFYKRVHYIHHRETSPNVWSSLYAHPVEMILSIILPIMLIPFIPVEVNLYVYIGTLSILNLVNIIGHCGYEITNTIVTVTSLNHWVSKIDKNRKWIGAIFARVSDHHDHHSKFSKNIGLYFTLWDVCFKTGDFELSKKHNKTTHVTTIVSIIRNSYNEKENREDKAS